MFLQAVLEHILSYGTTGYEALSAAAGRHLVETVLSVYHTRSSLWISLIEAPDMFTQSYAPDMPRSRIIDTELFIRLYVDWRILLDQASNVPRDSLSYLLGMIQQHDRLSTNTDSISNEERELISFVTQPDNIHLFRYLVDRVLREIVVPPACLAHDSLSSRTSSMSSFKSVFDKE